VAFNINKTGHHVIRYNWHIVESGVLTPIKLANHQVIRCTWHIGGGGVPTFDNMSCIAQYMVTSFIGVEHHSQ
jgi:hypothetical protein